MIGSARLLAAPASDEARWAAISARDGAADGSFYYAVTTTGVYCRPGCAARLPKREHVRFFADRAEAEAAGYRPCKRCKPDRPSLDRQHAEAVRKACRLMEAAPEEPKLADLAASVSLSPSHFHRLFKQALGVTPKAYAAAKRQERVRQSLRDCDSVTAAIYDAGFKSNGRFYANSSEMLGMTPTDFRSGAAGQDIRYAIGECSLGLILVAASAKGVCAIFFGDDAERLRRDLAASFPRAKLTEADRDFAALMEKVVAYVETPDQALDLPLDIRGTAFQHRVWDALRRIPSGSTASYAEVAKRIGAPGAVRAVARACATNPIAVAIPCHRVVRSDGSLSGYRGGVHRKRALLARESKSKRRDFALKEEDR